MIIPRTITSVVPSSKVASLLEYDLGTLQIFAGRGARTHGIDENDGEGVAYHRRQETISPENSLD